MSSVVAIVKSIVGQVFVVSPEGVRRVLVEGDRLYVGDQIDTGLSGAVSLELADGRTLDLGRETQWSANTPDSSTDLAEATAQAAPSVEELQQAIAAGVDPTTALEATAAGPSAAGTGGAAGGGHSFVMLDATAGRVDPTIGFPTAGINSAGQAAQDITAGQTADTTTNALRDSTLSLSATPTITEAGGVLVYTATLTQAPLTDLTITLSNGAVIVIPAGSTTGTVNVPMAPNDTVYNDPTQINVTVTGTTGGNGITVAPPTLPASTQVTDTIDTTTVTLTAGQSVTEGGQITYTATLTNPAQTPVTVTLSNGSTITIGAGQTTGTVNVPTAANDVYNNGSTVSTTITGATGGNFENLVPSTTPAVTTITDSVDNTGLTLTATNNIVEGGQITYTATLTNPAQTPVTVTLSNGSTITIAAGETVGTVNVPTAANDVYNNGSTVSTTITGATGGNFENLVPNTTPAVTTIADSVDNTGLTLTATNNIVEGGQITYTATLTNPAQTPVTVTLSNGSTITIAAGETVGTVNVPTAANDVYNNGSTVSTTITGATGGNFENLVPSTTPAVTTITDSVDNTGLTLSATGSVAEGGSIVYTATLTNPAGTPVTVNLSNGSVITIDAGKTTGTVTVPAPADDVYKDAGQVEVTIKDASGGNFENLVPSTTPAVTEITDTVDTSTVKLTADTSVAEGGTVTYTATVGAPVTGSPVVVTLANGQSITIAVGQTAGSITTTAPNDALAGNAPLTNSITNVSGGNYENLVADKTPVSTNVTDVADTTSLSLSATGTVAEGGQITYTATLSNPAGTPVTVNLSNGSVITIEAGKTTGTVTVDAPKDDVYKDAGKVEVSIKDATGGNFENLVPSTTPAVTDVTDTVDTSTVKLTADTSVAEGGTVTYTATVGAPVTGSPVVVTLANGQSITIAVGQTAGSITTTAPNDALAGNAPLTNSITNVSGGNYENLVADKTPVSTNVTDVADTTSLSLSATGTVAEGGQITYTATLSNAAGSPVTVTLSNGAVITIKAGETSGTAIIAAPSDDVYKDAGAVQATISSATGGNFENLVSSTTPAVTQVTDTVDTSTVKLTADTSVAEGGTVTYTATVGAPVTGSPVVVTLANGQNITIAVGQTTGSVTATVSNDVQIGHAPLSNSISNVSGGNYENLIADKTPVSTTVTDTVDTTSVALTATGNVNEGGQITYTATLSNPAGTPVTVNLSNGSTITIEAGKTTGTVTVPAPADDVYKDAGKVEVTIKDATGGNFENLVPNPTPAVTNVADTVNTTHLTLSAESCVLEGTSITYTATLTNAAQTPVTVKLSNGETITIEAGKTSGSVTIAAPSDDVYKDVSKLTVTMTDASGGNFEKLDVSKTPVSTTVNDTVDKTALTLTASDTVSEGGQITYTATLSNPAGSAMTVTLANGAVINIAAGATSGSVNFPAPANTPYIDGSNVRTAIASHSGGDFEKVEADRSAVVTKVTDAVDTTNISLSATGSVAEGGSIVYTATLSNPAGTAMTVTLSNGAVINIAKGASTGTATVAAPGDDVYKDAGKVDASITKTSGGNFENLVVDKTPAFTNVTDTIDNSTVSLTASASAVEGGVVVYTASVTAPVTGLPVVVTLSNGQTITIPVGSSSASVNFTAPNDAQAGGNTLSVKIDGASGGNYENLVADQTPAVTSVTDTVDATNLSLSATGSVAEGGSIVYTATLSNPAGTPVTVNLSNGAVITIEAGKTTGTVTVPAPADDVYKDAGKVEVTIKDATGGNFENLVPSAAPAITDVTDTVDTSTVKLTATETAAEGGTVTYTATVGAPVTGSPVVVTLANGQNITIEVGKTSGSVSTTAPNDVLAGHAPLSNSITNVSGGNFENLVADKTPVSTIVTDTVDTTNLSLSATGSVSEGGQITYTATLTNAAGSPVTVTLSNGATITIDAGQTTGTVTVDAPKDDVYKDAGSVEATIKNATGGDFENLVTNLALAVTTVNDTIDSSTVSLSATANVAEGETVVYTATVSAPVTGSPVIVNLSNGQSITIAVGETTGSVNYVAPNSPLAGGSSLSVTIDGATGGNYEKLVVDGKSADTVVADTNDTTHLNLTASDSVAEGGQITYTATLTNPAGTPVTVTLSNGAVITIKAGETSGNVTVDAPKDDVYKDAGKVEVTIEDATGGSFENLVPSAVPAVTNVTDTIDTSTVKLTADTSVAEGGTVTYTATVGAPVTGSPVVVALANGQSITIEVGKTTGSITYTAPNDALTGNAPLNNSITGVSGGNFEDLVADKTPVSTTVTDVADTTTLSLSATGSVAEGGSIVYTATLTNAAGTPVTVTLSNGAVITIKAGETTGTATVPAPTDDVYKDAGSVQATITSATGGNFENLVPSTTPAITQVTDTIDTSTVKLTADTSVAEGGTVTYTATVGAPVTGSPVVVTLANGQAITIGVGKTTGTATVIASNDALAGHAPISTAITNVSGGNFENLVADKTEVSTAVTDTVDTTDLSLSATGSVAEGGQITYTATLTNAAGTPVTVTLSNGAVITIKAGETTGTATVDAPKDDVYKDAGSVQATITSATGGNFENLVPSTAPAVTTVTDTIDTSTVKLTADTSVAEGGTVTYTATVGAPVTGSPVVVTLANGQNITIAVGQTTGTATVIASNDALAGHAPITTAITNVSGGNFENLVADKTEVSTAVTDTVDTTNLSLSATGSVAEGGQIIYTATLTNAAGTPVTVTLSNGAVITIKAGETSGNVTVDAPKDDVYKDAGSVQATITSATGGNFENLVPSTTPAITQVTDTIDTSTVKLTADTSVAEGGTVTYTATVGAPVTGSPVVVTLANGQNITIAVGQTTGTATVAASNDALAGHAPITTAITNVSGGNFENLVADKTEVSTTVTDTVDTTNLSLSATGSVAEGGSIVYTATLTNAAGTPVTVTLSNGAVITIKAGETTGTATVPAPSDDVYKDAGEIEVTIKDASGGNFENLVPSTAPAVTTVTDTIDTSTVKLTADTSVAEGGTVTYTATVGAPVTGSPVVVTLANGQNITIEVGKTTGTATVIASNDALAGHAPITTAITNVSGGNFENLVADKTEVSTTVADTVDTTNLSLSATGSVAEGGSIVYTATLTNAAGTPVTVTLSNGAVITIKAGETTGTATVPAPSDDVYKDAGSVQATITSATGGNFENLVPSTTPAVTQVTDTIDTSTVKLTADTSVAEGGTVTYTATVGAPVTGSPVVVTLANGQNITIAVGQTTGTATVIASNDALAGHAPITTAITNVSGGNFENLVADKTEVSTAVTDTVDTTNLSLSATGSVAEGGQIIYTATLTNAAGTPVTVTLSNGAVITIKAGETTGTATVPAPIDDVYKDAGSVQATITSATGGNFENLVPSTTPAITQVTDTIDTSTVKLTADTSVAEGGTVTYTATVGAPVTGSPVVVTLANGQAITIGVGKTTGTATVIASNDALAGHAPISTAITNVSGGNFENLVADKTEVSTAVTDTVDTTDLSLSATGSVAEGGQITYTATLTNAAGTPVTVTLSNGAVITIKAGETTGTATVDAPKDDVYKDAGSVQATITSATGGNFENLVPSTTPAVTQVTDTIDTSTVKLTADTSVAEGGTVTYTATVGAPVTGSPVVVTLANGQAITIEVGKTTGTATVIASNDALAGHAPITTAITNVSGGNFENLVADKTEVSTTVTDTVDTTNLTLSATGSVAEGGQITYTATLTNAAGTPVTVTLSNGAVITIKAGETTGTATVPAPSDDVYKDAGEIEVTIKDASGGNFENLVPSTAPAVTTVTDTIDTSTVKLTADTSVAEGGTVTYTATVGAPVTGSPVVVTLANGQAIIIGVGQTTGTATVIASNDALAGHAPITTAITNVSGGNFENLVADKTEVRTTVTDTVDTTNLSLSATGSVAEGGSIVYTATLTNAAGTPVTVTLSNGAVITIKAGETTGNVTVDAPKDDVYKDAGSVQATITSATGGNFENLVPSKVPAVTQVSDTVDTTNLSLSATGSVAEGGQIIYTATLTNAAGTPVTVTLSNGAVITIKAGETTGNATVPAPTDDVYKDAGSVQATITSATGGNFENLVPSTAPAVTTVTDTIDTSTVKLTADTSVAEGGTVTYTATVGAPVTGSPVVVTLANGQNISIEVGKTTGTATVIASNDALAGHAPITTAITNVSGGNFENLVADKTEVSTAVTDTVDTTNLSLSATGSVAEGGQIIYTATLTNAAGTPVTVTLSNGAVITIKAGETTGTATVPAPIDDVYKDAGSVQATITSATGGNFENLVPSTTPAITQVTDTIDTSTVKLTADTSVAEGGTVTYTATVGAPVTGSPVVVTLANGQNITIAVGQTTGTATVIASNDALTGHAPITTAITNVSGGNFENLVADKTPVSTTVTDTVDTTNLSLSASNSVAEGGQITYTATLTNPAGSPVTVTLSNGAVITIEAGKTSGSATVPAPSDDVYKDAGTVQATITSATGGNFENLVPSTTPAVTSVTDTVDTTTVSITGSSSVTEGQTASYTVSLNHPAQTEVTLKIVYSGTAADGSDFTGVYTVKIPAGASSAQFNVATLDDKITEGTENFVVKIDSATGGNFENLAVSGTNGSVSTSIIDNDAPPVLDLDANNSSGATGADYKVTFTENTQGAGVSIADTDLKITDPDSTMLTGATVVLTNRQDGDALNLGNSVNGISITPNSTNGTVTLTLSGNATLADYMQAIKNISFTNSSDDPSTVPRIITVTVTDGGNYSNTATTTVNVVGINDAPFAAPSNVTGTEDTPLVLGWSTFGVSDVDSPASSLGVKITQLPGEGKLQYLDGSTWKDVATNQTFSKADIDAGKLRFLPDANESGANGYGGTGLGNNQADYAQIKFQPTDGQALGSTGTIKIDITPVADAPTVGVADNSVKSTGLIKEVWTGLSGLGTNGNGADSTTLKNVIDAGGKPNSSSNVTNVQSDGSVAAGTASKTSGLMYLEAGKTYSFSGVADDSLLITIGGKNVASGTWGAGGAINGSFTPTTSGYYTLDIYHHNQSGPGSYDVNLSVNGSTPIDLSSAGVPIYTGVQDLVNSGVTVSDLHGTNGEGYYDGYKLNTGAEGTTVKLSAVTTALSDTDGSETLSVKISGAPVGSVLSDGAGHTFTVTASNGEANVTGWSLGSLTVTPPPYYNGQFNLTVTSTATEQVGGSASSTATIPVTVVPAVYNAVTATSGDDDVIGTDANDIIVADIGGLTVVPGTNYNIAFMVDSSGSMSTSSLNAAKDSLTSVFNSLKQSLGGSNSGTVNIFLVDFDTQVNKSVSVNLNDPNALTLLKAVLNSMGSGGGTNYEDVFKTTANWFQSADAVANTGAKNLTYFITDGQPTYYQSGEQTNPLLYGNVKLDSVVNTSNYKPGDTFGTYVDNSHYLSINSAGSVVLQTYNPWWGWSSETLGTIHAQGDGTYELSNLAGTGNSTNSSTSTNSASGFALLSGLSNVEAIGLNSGVTLDDLKPYDSDKTPQTNIDPKDLANSIIGHTEATMPGNDTVNGGDGNDILFGDLVSFNGIAGEGYQAMQAFVAKETGVDVSKVSTSNVHQYITEHYQAFDVSGAHDGDDSLLGGAGNDILFGSGGKDLLDGGKGNDILLGGSGNDTLMGGQGNDILIGGSGGDTFVWTSGDTGSDVIKDFKASEGDRIDLRDLLQGETGSTIDNFLKITTVDGTSSLQVSSGGKFNSADAAAATPDVTIKLDGNNWSSANLHNLIAGSDPTIKVDHNNS